MPRRFSLWRSKLTLDRPARLVALIAFVMAASSALLVLNMRSASIDELHLIAEKNNSAMAGLFAVALSRQINAEVLTGGVPLAPDALAGLHRDMTKLLADSPILRVKLFARNGLLLYSSDLKRINENRADSAGYQAAIEGRTLSKIVYPDETYQFDDRPSVTGFAATYVSIRSDDLEGGATGVFEIYYDLTHYLTLMRAAFWRVAFIAFGATALVILLVVLYARRTAALRRQEKQSLYQQVEVARVQSASQAKSEYLASMSHEFRTPLNAIVGFSEIMASELMGPHTQPKYREYALDIWNAGKHLLALINDLLDMAKIEAGQLKLQITSIDPAKLAAQCHRLLRERATEAGVDWILAESNTAIPRVAADETKLQQILLNLLSNAMKFTPRGWRVVLAIAPIGTQVEFSVTDTGVGMTPGGVAAALKPFEQIENALSHKHKGTGLGLPIARRLTELHGGTLAIESEYGRGTTVRIRLPRAATSPDQGVVKPEIRLAASA